MASLLAIGMIVRRTEEKKRPMCGHELLIGMIVDDLLLISDHRTVRSVVRHGQSRNYHNGLT